MMTKNASISHLYITELHWPPVTDDFNFKTDLMSFKVLTTQQPCYHYDMLHTMQAIMETDVCHDA